MKFTFESRSDINKK